MLITTRQPALDYPAYPTVGSNKHRYLSLEGLYPEDALAYYQALMKLSPEPQLLPPKREELLDLFGKVAFHPLSMGLLAYQLKFRRIAELGERLEQLLQDTPNTKDNPEKSLLASLNLSLERLTPEARQWLPRLGVFQGGAWEPALLQITELAESEWAGLQQELATTGLIQIEHLPGVNSPFLKFHPTLAPVLWSRLSPEEQADLSARHRQRYYALSKYLCQPEIRTIAWLELPNLFHAVHAALKAGEGWGMDFADKANLFLGWFGLNRDQEALNQQMAQADSTVGSYTWYLARGNLGTQLFRMGRFQEAEKVFTDILQILGYKPTYQRCHLLDDLGRFLYCQGQAARAEECYREGLAVAEQLEPSDGGVRKTRDTRALA